MMREWPLRDKKCRKNYVVHELNKLILKSLMVNTNIDFKIYIGKIFLMYTKFSSISFYRRSCLFTSWSRSVFQKFKLVRHQCKRLASYGYLIGLRKSSF